MKQPRLVALLCIASLILAGIGMYQDKVIAAQGYEIRALFKVAFPEQ